MPTAEKKSAINPPALNPQRPLDCGPGEIILRYGHLITPDSLLQELLNKFPAFENSWTPELQSKWFEVFLELVIQINLIPLYGASSAPPW